MNTEQIQAATPWTVGEVRSPGGVDWDIVLRDADNSPIAFVRVAGWTKKRAIAHANSIVNAVNSYEAREALIADLVTALEVSATHCEHVHHNPGKYHEAHQPCPVAKKIQAALTAAKERQI